MLWKNIPSVPTQPAIWRRTPEADPRVPRPDGFGCTVTNDTISIDWMSLLLAPEALLDMIIYGCTGFCSTGHCTCNWNGLSRTDACQCGDDCNNPHITWGFSYFEQSDSDTEKFNVYSNELSLCSDYMYIAALLHAD